MRRVWDRVWGRIGPWPWGRIALVSGAVVLVVAVVPPFRRAAANVTSRAILLAATPLAPDVKGFDRLPSTSRILAADGTLLAELNGGQRRQPVRLAELPPAVPHAVLAAEDADFYHHSGIDPSAVFRAVVRNAQGRSQGGSTITQQLAKINYTGSRRTVFRKLKEVLYASQLERKYSKNQLLERYLNQVYFGDGAYGIAAAAQTYFGIQPTQLSTAQAATLAGKIHAPEFLDPRKRPAIVAKRRNRVLAAMRKHHWLDAAGARAAEAEPLQVVPPAPPAAVKAAHFVNLVEREAAGLDALGGTSEARSNQLFSGGLTIETTLDPKIFDASAETAKAQLGRPDDPAAAIVSVQPGDGAVRNLFDGGDPSRKFGVSWQGHRQPGSSFKPFVYVTALGDGIDPRSRFDSGSPKTLSYPSSGTYEVHNYEGEGGGSMTVDDALVHSVNTVFAQLILEVGPPNVVEVAAHLGLKEKIRPYPAIALGGLTKGVSPLEMAAAYATFAANGTYAEPYSIVRIRDAEDHVVYAHHAKTRRVMSRDEAGVLNRTLERVVREGTGTGAAIDRPVAGKTGTTQNYGDAWFVGYVPQLATAVWVGHPDKVTPMTDVHGRKVSGGSFPAAIFSGVMRAALEGEPVRQLYTANPEDLNLHLLSPAPPSTVRGGVSSTLPTSTTVVSGTVAPPPPGSSTTSTTVRTTTTTTKTTTSTSTSTTSTTATTQAPATTTTAPRKTATQESTTTTAPP